MCMRENSWMGWVMGKAYIDMRMGILMRGFGLKIREKERGFLGVLTVMFFKDSSLKEMFMVQAPIPIPMERNINASWRIEHREMRKRESWGFVEKSEKIDMNKSLFIFYFLKLSNQSIFPFFIPIHMKIYNFIWKRTLLLNFYMKIVFSYIF